MPAWAHLLALTENGARQDHDAADSPEGQLLGGVVRENPEKARSASPVTYVSEAAPPFLIIHGSDDPIIPHAQSEILARALKQAGVETYLVTVANAGHGGFRNPEVVRRIHQFFDKQLSGKPETISEEAIPNR